MRWTAVMAVVFVLVGCAQPNRQGVSLSPERQRYLEKQEAIRQSQSVPVAYVSLGCTGHGNVGYIHSYAVQETIHGQFSRRMVNGLSCGGTVAAGYPVPRTWTPGMKVKVRWKPNGRDYVEKITTIPRHDEVGMLIVHFFPNDEVRVVVSNYYPESRYHPIPFDSSVPPPEPD